MDCLVVLAGSVFLALTEVKNLKNARYVHLVQRLLQVLTTVTVRQEGTRKKNLKIARYAHLVQHLLPTRVTTASVKQGGTGTLVDVRTVLLAPLANQVL